MPLAGAPWRARLMLAATLVGLREHGFLLPCRHAADARPIGYPAVEAVLEAALPTFAGVLSTVDGLAADLEALAGPPPQPRFEQDWFPRLDAAVTYALVRSRVPGRIVEVGSGHSTRFMARAIRDGGFACTLTCIDPAPRATLAGLDIVHVPMVVQAAPAQLFASLAAGDMLFIDSSHLAMPGSDVDVLINAIVPSLPAGVLLHVHDVFLPDPYPEGWAWRGYNEQLLVAGLLTTGRLEPVFASRFVATRRADLIESSLVGRLPLAPGAYETSLWGRLR